MNIWQNLALEQIDELVGRVDLLKVKDGVSEGKADEVCLSKILDD